MKQGEGICFKSQKDEMRFNRPQTPGNPALEFFFLDVFASLAYPVLRYLTLSLKPLNAPVDGIGIINLSRV